MGFAPLPRSGIFAALDVTTNKLVWRQRWLDQCYSGSVATAGGLVFVGRNDGRLTALELRHRQEAVGVPDRRRHERDREHVRAATASSTSSRTRPAMCWPAAAKGDSVWLFALDGTLPPAKERDSAGCAGGCRAGASGRCQCGTAARRADITSRPACRATVADGKGGHGGGAPLDKARDLASVVLQR